MLLQSELHKGDDGGGVVTEENFLHYRLQIVQRMADGPLKAAIVTAIVTRAEELRKSLVVFAQVGLDVIRSGSLVRHDAREFGGNENCVAGSDGVHREMSTEPAGR